MLLLAHCPPTMNTSSPWVNPQQAPLDISLAADDETEWICLFSNFFFTECHLFARLGCVQPDSCPAIVLVGGHFPSAEGKPLCR